MSEEEYLEALRTLGLRPSGDSTTLTECWIDQGGHEWMVPKPNGLSSQDRKTTISRFTQMMTIQSGVH